MKIERVRIQNFRSIRDLTFLTGDLCALIGGNNAGKSNLLKAINLVLGDRWPSVRQIDDADFFGCDPTAEIAVTIWFDETREVRGDVGDPVPFSGICFRVSRYKRRSGKHQQGDLRSEFCCVGDNGEAVEVLKRPNQSARPYPKPAPVSTAIREQLPTVFIDIDRSARYHLSGSQWSILGRLLREVSNSLKSDATRFALFREKFDEARSIIRTPEFEGLEKTVLEQLEAHTGLSGVRVIFDDMDPLNLYKSFSVLFQDEQTPVPVDATRMGSGIQSAVVISLLQAYRELRKENAVLLFEEPEFFLHPHGRRHLYRLLCDLADSGTQILYTTHSQDLVDLTRMDCVRLVTNTTTDGTQAAPPTKAALSDDWRTTLNIARQFGSPRDEIFFADSVVLTEGVTEQATIRILAEMMPTPLDLDRNNCSVIEVGGKPSLPLMIRIVRALRKPMLVIYDTDSHHNDPIVIARDEELNDEIVAALNGEGELFACDPQFEAIADLPPGNRKKEHRAREFLSSLKSWDDVPADLKALMAHVRNLIA